MNTPDIIEAARARLAEIEAEATKLRAMIAAAEGRAPVPQLVPLPVPVPTPLPAWPAQPITPYQPGDVWPFGDRVTCGTSRAGGIVGRTEPPDAIGTAP